MKRIFVWAGYLVLAVLLHVSEMAIVPASFATFQFTAATILYFAIHLLPVFYLFFLRDCAEQSSIRINVILLVVTVVLSAIVFHWFPTSFNLALYLLAEELYTTAISVIQKKKA